MKFFPVRSVVSTTTALILFTLSTTFAAATESMSKNRFWSIINQSAQLQTEPYSQIDALKHSLKALPSKDIVAFNHALAQEMARAYSWDLWGAAYIINGGASNDGFIYFRLWLISKGSELFEATLRDPDALATANVTPGPDGVYELEELMYVAGEAWVEKTGNGYSTFPRDGASQVRREPLNSDFDFNVEELSKRYPKLWKHFGNAPLPR